MEQFSYVKRGYDPEQVDKYIANLEAILRNYKEKDNVIKNAILSAQVAADTMIKNARLQCDEYKIQITKEILKAREELEQQRMRIKTFHDIYSNLIKKYLRELDDDDMNELMERLNDVDAMLLRFLDENTVLPSDISN